MLSSTLLSLMGLLMVKNLSLCKGGATFKLSFKLLTCSYTY